MNAIEDTIKAVREAILLAYKVDKLGSTLSDLAKELRNQNDRIIKLETILEVQKYQKESALLEREDEEQHSPEKKKSRGR